MSTTPFNLNNFWNSEIIPLLKRYEKKSALEN